MKRMAGAGAASDAHSPGQEGVGVPAILNRMEGRRISGMVMVELDNDWRNMSPTPSADLVKQSRDYLESIGIKFRSV